MFEDNQAGNGAAGDRGGDPWALITRMVTRLGYTGRHRARTGRRGYGEAAADDPVDSPYVSVDELLSSDC